VNVLILSDRTDIAGIGITLKQAFDKHSRTWKARAVRRKDVGYGYPADIEWNGRVATRVIGKLYAAADVIHVLQRPYVATKFPGWQSKAIVVHHLGTYFRRDPASVSASCQDIGATELAGSLDLIPLGDMELLPIVADIERFAAIRERVYRPSKRIRIAHAPTNRAFKSTINFIDAVTNLAKRHPIEVDLIEGVSWEECLRRKAQADILFDELTHGYGANALEAWAMDIPVVSGVHDERVRELMVGAFGAIPFLEATPRSLERVLESLIIDPDLRSAVALRGRKHVERFHSGAAVVARATDIYERLLERKAAA
jgi:hypothetical protein